MGSTPSFQTTHHAIPASLLHPHLIPANSPSPCACLIKSDLFATNEKTKSRMNHTVNTEKICRHDVTQYKTALTGALEKK